MSDNNSPRWPRFVLALVAILALAGIIVVAILRDRIVGQQLRNVTVTGQGRITYQPDLALVTLGVQIDKVARPDAALSQLNAKVAGIIAAVKTVGVPASDIQTQNYSLYPQYDYRDNVSTVAGYSANEQLVIKVTGYDQDQEKLSRVIAAASEAGANQVNSLAFDSSRMNELRQQARLAAITDAREKSKDLAATAGVRLGRIISWYENMATPVPYVAMDYAKGLGGGGSAAPQTPAGDREVVIEVGVTYNIK